MPDFLYHAIDRHGHTTDGTMSAPDEERLEAELRAVGYWLIDARKEERRQTRQRIKVSRRDLVDFYHGISALLEAGVSVADSFRAMSEEVDNEALRHIIEDVEVHVQTGNEISSALRNYPNVFSDEVCNIVRAGERSGNLPRTFSELAEHTEWVERIVGDIKQASVYPVMVMSAVAGLIALLFVFVIPRFAGIFGDLDMELPFLTRVIINLGNIASSYWWAILGAGGGAFAALRYAPQHSKAIRRSFDRFKLNVPVFGPVNRLLAQSQLTHNLSLLLRAGVPILDSLRLCRGLVGNSTMQEAVQAAEIAVSEGRRASDAFREYDVVSSLTLRMFILGEETGSLDSALEHVTKRFDEEIPRRVKRIFSILEPLITVFLVVVVGLVAASLFLPMFSLIGGLGP